jgi:transposase
VHDVGAATTKASARSRPDIDITMKVHRGRIGGSTLGGMSVRDCDDARGGRAARASAGSLGATARPHVRRVSSGAVIGPTEASEAALRSLGRRSLALQAEVAALDEELERFGPPGACPRLLAILGTGSETAGCVAASRPANPERVRSEAAFATLCGVSPVDASSGKIRRHRLNRGGDRHANAGFTGS